jgi:hypothetical protein
MNKLKTWTETFFNDCKVGISLYSEDETTPGATDGITAGSVYILDSVFENTEIAVWSQSPASTEQGTTIITLDNIGLANVGVVIYLLDGLGPNLDGNTPIDVFTLGDIEPGGTNFGAYGYASPDRPTALSLPVPSPRFARGFWFSQRCAFSR